MLCLKVLVSAAALWGAAAQQPAGGFSLPLQAGRQLGAFGQAPGRQLDSFGQVAGRQLDAFGQAAGVPPGTLPLAATSAPQPQPPRRSPVLGPRPAASGRLPEDAFGPPEPYQFQYSVSDVESGAAFRQQENSDGRGIEGQYVVQLPDGRNQIVKYTATEETGFHAEVSYEGEPVFPPTAGGGGGGGGRPGGGQQPRSLPPRPAPSAPVAGPSLAPPLAAPGGSFAAPGFGRPDGNLVAPRAAAPAAGSFSGGAFGSAQQAFGSFDAPPRAVPGAGFDAPGRAVPGGGFSNALEAAGGLVGPGFGPTGADLAIPGGPAFGSFGASAPGVAVGGRRLNHRG